MPKPDYLLLLLDDVLIRSSPQQHNDMLLEMALQDKRLDDVLHWYDKITSDKKSASQGWLPRGVNFEGDRVAKAVAKAYPERALEIYRRKLEAYLPRTGVPAYETCGDCLRLMRSIYQAQNREDYWNELLADIREKYHNRPRFMEILDKLEGRTILQMRQKRRR